MKQFLMKYLIGLGLIISFVFVVSPKAVASPPSCHIEKQACNKVECINKDCSNSCKAHCKHD